MIIIDDFIQDKDLLSNITKQKDTFFGPNGNFMWWSGWWNNKSKTIKDIAATASEIYDKAVNVYDSFNTVNQSLDKARLKMDEAKSRLQDGPGSLTKKVEKMKKLGRLNTKKQLPEDSGNAID